MAFIRERLSSKQEESYSYQIIETYREGGKVKQRVLYNMGPSPTIKAALEMQHKVLANQQESLARYPERRDIPFIEKCQREIEWTKRNIAFLETVVVSNEGHFYFDTTSPVYLPRHPERLGVVSNSTRGRL
jgi:hypothetical protein